MLTYGYQAIHFLKLSVVAALCLAIAGCGSSGQESEFDSSSDLAVNGHAIKGVIHNGIAQAYRIEEYNGKRRARQAVGLPVRTDSFGAFNLRLPSATVTSSLLVEISADSQTKMTCDDLSGCGVNSAGEAISFGEHFDLNQDFSMKAVLPELRQGRRNQLSVTPLSHLAVARAEGSAAGLTADNVSNSYRYIEAAMGLESGDLQLEPVDITQLERYENLEKGQLKLALMSASFLSLVEDAGVNNSIEQVLESAANAIAESGTVSSNSNETNVLALDELNLQASQMADALAAEVNDAEQLSVLNDINEETEAAYEEHTAVVAEVEIIQHPQSLTPEAGNNANFAVQATGGGVLQYQWRHNGSPLMAATSAELTIVNAQSEDQGIYDVVITNNAGSVISLAAVLELNEVEPVNSAPIANDDTISLLEGESVQVAVLANDIDPDGDSLQITAAEASIGSVTINTNNTLSYQAGAEQQGLVNISYTVSDGRGGEASAILRATVGAVNDAPLAQNDSASTNEDQAVNINVLANDSDVDGDTLSITQVSATNGLAAVNANNSILFVPVENVSGDAVINYTVSDGNGGTASAQVLVTIRAVNDNPVARDDSVSTTEDRAVIINVLANDSDIDGDSLRIVSTSSSNGSVENIEGERLRYTPSLDFSGLVSIHYTISDDHGGSHSATVTVNVGGTNDVPVAVNDVASVIEDQDVVIDVLANDSDADGNPLSISHVSATHGSASILDSQEILFTPPADFNGLVELSYTVNDGQGGSASAVVMVTVSEENDAPVGVDDVATTQEDNPITINVLANDSDVDGDELSLVAASASHGSVVINNQNRLRYIPDENYSGTVTIDYSLQDVHGLQDSAFVTLTVLAQNDQPVAVNDTATGSEDTQLEINVLANDSDVDGDALEVSQVSATHGDANVTNNQRILFVPSPNFHGTATLSYTVSDGQGGSASATVEVVVAAVNDSPVAGADSATTDAGSSVSINALANDSDVDGDSLSISSAAAANGAVSVDAQGVVSYVPEAGFSGEDTIFYSLVDGQGGSDTGSIHVTVNAVQNTASVQLSWDIPSEREDGTSLELYDIGGYTIAYGNQPDSLNSEVSIEGALVTDYQFQGLTSGTYYFAIATVDSAALQGVYSSTITVTVP